MKTFIAFLLLYSCASVKPTGHTKFNSTIKACGSELANFEDLEYEAQNICGRSMSILKCGYEVTSYVDLIPIENPCCDVYCPEYPNRRRYD